MSTNPFEPSELIPTIEAAPHVQPEWLQDHRICILEACAKHPALTDRQASKLMSTGWRDVLVALALRTEPYSITAELQCRIHGFGWLVDYRRTGDLSACPVRVVGGPQS